MSGFGRVFLLLIPTCLLAAAEPPGDPKPLPARKDSIVVTGSAQPVILQEADRSVAAIPLREQPLLFNTWVDALRLDPSLDLRERSPNGATTDLSIRGSTFNQTLVLVDGLRMNDPQTGHFNMDLPLTFESMERVETLKGAGSTLYGADALGGVVNVVTKPPEQNEIRLRGALGNYGINQERVALTGIWKALTEQVSFFRDFTTGFMPNRDYRNLVFSSVTHLQTKLGDTSVTAGYSDKPFGAQDFYGVFPSWERTKAWMVGGKQMFGERSSAAFLWRRHTDDFALYRDRPWVYYNRHLTNAWQGNVRRSHELRPTMTLSYGFDVSGDDIVSSNLGNHSRARGAGYVSLDMRVLKRFSFSLGVRDEILKGLPGVWTPSLAVGYWAGSKVKLRASASRAFRIPTYTELYYRDPRNIGNPFLKPEDAWSFEGGVDFHPGGQWQLTTAVFQRRETNGIDYVRPNVLDPWVAVNIQQLTFTGLEAQASTRWRAQQIDFAYTFLHGAENALNGLESKYAFNYPVHSGVFSWTGQLAAQIAVRTRLGALVRLGRDPYAVWDVYAARSSGILRPFLQFTNLTGSRYQEIPGVPMPGRTVLGGVEILIARRR